MGTKKGKQWRSEINTDEEWNQMLSEKKGLVVVEIFSAEYGPCRPMHNIMHNYKLSTDSEYLHMVLAKSDNIEILKRFRDKSEPVWMLISSGKLITILFGVNAPNMLTKLKSEFENELKVQRGEMKRVEQSFSTITKDEKMKAQRNEEIQREIENREIVETVKRLGKYRLPALERLKHFLKYRSLVMYFPSGKLATGECPVMTKMSDVLDDLQLVCISLEDVQMTHEKMQKTFAESGFDIPKPLKELMLHKTCEVTVVQDNAKRFELGEIEIALASAVYGNPVNGEIDCNKPRINSLAAIYSTRAGKGNPKNVPILPVIWTPIDEMQKCAAMDALFPYKLEDEFKYISPELPPLQTVMIFEAIYGKELEAIILDSLPIIYKYGYFTSSLPEEAQFISKTWVNLLKFHKNKISTAKLVFGIKDKSDEILLEFFITDPIYISSDLNIGSIDAEKFFPFNYDELSDIPIKSKHKK